MAKRITAGLARILKSDQCYFNDLATAINAIGHRNSIFALFLN